MNQGPHPSCKCCAHDDVDTINAAIRQGAPLEDLSKKYNLSASSLWRHRKSHVGPVVTSDGRRTRTLRAINGMGPTERLEKLLADLNGTLNAAPKSGKQNSIVQCAREIRETMKSLADAKKFSDTKNEMAEMAATCRYLVSLFPLDIVIAIAKSQTPFNPSDGVLTPQVWDRVREGFQKFERGEEYEYERPKSSFAPVRMELPALN